MRKNPAAWRARWPPFWRWWHPRWCLLGVLATPLFIDVIAPGFHGAKRELAIRIVRVLFPGAGLLVHVGVVPGHSEQPSQVLPVLHRAGGVEFRHDRRAGVFRRRMAEPSLAVTLAWGSVAGSALQFGVQAAGGAAPGAPPARPPRHRVPPTCAK